MLKLPSGRKKYGRVTPADDDVISGAAPVTVSLKNYKTGIHTGGTEGAETVTLPDGEYVGQRKLLVLEVRTHASDSVTVTATNIDRLQMSGETPGAVAGLVLDAANEYALVEWSGSVWNLLYTNGTVS